MWYLIVSIPDLWHPSYFSQDAVHIPRRLLLSNVETIESSFNMIVPVDKVYAGTTHNGF